MNKQTWKLKDGPGENRFPENFADKTLINRKIQNHSYGFVQSPNPATPKLQHRLGARLNRCRGASTIARSKEAPSPTRLYESINRPSTRNMAHIAMARQRGDVHVLPWTKIYFILSMKSNNNDKSTSSRLTFPIPKHPTRPIPQRCKR
jgi:hypothetical protein